MEKYRKLINLLSNALFLKDFCLEIKDNVVYNWAKSLMVTVPAICILSSFTPLFYYTMYPKMIVCHLIWQSLIKFLIVSFSTIQY